MRGWTGQDADPCRGSVAVDPPFYAGAIYNVGILMWWTAAACAVLAASTGPVPAATHRSLHRSYVHPDLAGGIPGRVRITVGDGDAIVVLGSA
jgi:hypothetical protein